MLSNLRIVSLGTIASRILGLLRDMAMTSAFGAGTVLDAFIVAFRVPNLARQLLGEGALSTAFLPVFVRCREESGDQAAREMMTAVSVRLAMILAICVLLSEVALGVVWGVMGLSESSRLLVFLLMVMLPYSLFICLAALFCAALHAQRQFLWPALVPVVLNVVWLIGLGLVSSISGASFTQVVVTACCVTFAGSLQMFLPLWALHVNKMGLIRTWRAGRSAVSDVFRAMIPVVVGMTILQTSALVDSLLAWGLAQPDDGGAAWCEVIGIPPLVESGTASALYIGQRMYQFPLGIFGVALGTVLFPLLTQHAQRGDLDQLRLDLAKGLRIMIAVAVPASAGLCLLAWPLTLALFQRGEFNLEDALLTSRMIAIYGAGVWTYIGLAILNRAFYATGDRITPMRFGFLALSLNLVFDLLFLWLWGGNGLALASVLACAIQMLLTLRRLNHQVGTLPWREIQQTLWKGAVATAVMSAACLGTMSVLPESDSLTSRLMMLGAPFAAGVIVYLASARILGLTELDDLLRRS